MRNPLTTRTAKSVTAKRSLTLLGVLVALLAAAAYAVAAPRGPAVATPRITSGPSGTTASTSARFAFTGERGVTFECSLDDASFRACTSPKSYSGLDGGSHELEVRARNRAGQTSDDAERRWRIDVSAPSISLWHPENGGEYNRESWDEGCPGERRICGTASDASGVDEVAVSIRQLAIGKWWNGSSFSSTRELFLTASGDDYWRYGLALPPVDGLYTLKVRAVDELGNATAPGRERTATFKVDRVAPPAPTIVEAPPRLTHDDDATFRFADAETPLYGYVCRIDGRGNWFGCEPRETFRNMRDGLHTLEVMARDTAGNLSASTSYTWRIDTDAPPKPRIVQKPSNPSSSSSATFGFTDSERGVGFECRLDRGAWTSCTSPVRYDGLADGRHSFSVRAVDAAGNRSGSADYSWTIATTTTVGQDFTVSGGFDGLLSPGVSGPLAVTITNPNGEAIVVESLTVTIQPGSSQPGCDGPSNLEVTPSNVSPANPLTVPANSSVTLPSGGVTAPQVLMRNLPTNQDACQGATFTFTYGGSAHS